jgi:acetate kinase
MHSDDAKAFNVNDKDEVSIAIVGGDRDLIFGDVLIRVKDSYALEMHIDTDEANAAELGKGALGAMIPVDVDDAAENVIYQPIAGAHAALVNVKAKS